jgi:hypothetical protein
MITVQQPKERGTPSRQPPTSPTTPAVRRLKRRAHSIRNHDRSPLMVVFLPK